MNLRQLSSLTILLCFYFTSATLLAQDKKLKVHALSLGAGMASSTTDNAKSGFGINLDFSTITNNHIISTYFNSGLNLTDNGPQEEFYELNLTYGRKWSLNTKLVLEAHAGVGVFIYEVDNGPNPFFVNIPDNTIGFPIRAKLLYYPSESFGLGINPNTNLNSIANTYSLNFVFQYNFN